MPPNAAVRSSRVFAATLLVASVLGSALVTAGGCGDVLSITPDNGAGAADARDASSEGGPATDPGAPPDDGGLDGSRPACTAMDVRGAELRLCAPRFSDGAPTGDAGDGAAPFLSGAYTLDMRNAQLSDETLPNTQVAAFSIFWDAQSLYFVASMSDVNAKIDTGNPAIEAMICAGDPETDYDEAHCVDFIVDYKGNLSGPPRFNASTSGITESVKGDPTAFSVTAKLPASLFGALVSGGHMLVNVTAISYELVGGSPPSAQSSMTAFFVPNRMCHHDAGAGSPFACGSADQSYEPVTWARVVLE